jgi:hypothetical protein
VRAQFSAKWLHDPLWEDGKAEFNIYDAQQARYGANRASEVIHIHVREPFSAEEMVKAEAGSKSATYPVLKLNQILRIPTGIYVYQQMHSAFWRTGNAQLVKATLTSNDSCGNTYKEFLARSGVGGWLRPGWHYEWRTYWEGMARGREVIHAPAGAIFYDELPMRVRTIDFTGESGTFEIQLATSIIGSKKDNIAFQKAKVDWSRSASGEIQVTVTPSDAGVLTRAPGKRERGLPRDEFLVDGKPPHVLREWHQLDGGVLKLKRSLRIDYWNYNQPGDLERALGSAQR